MYRMLIENCLCCEIKNGTAECAYCKIGYMAKDGKCQKCSLENCLDCYFYEGKEKCYKCKDGYGIEEGKCQKCFLEKCLDCYKNEGKERCYKCKDGYGIEDGKCFNCKILDKNCISCDYGFYTIGTLKCYKCDVEIDNSLYNKEKCLIYCSDKNCLKCSLNGEDEICDQCKEGYYLKKDEKNNGQCVAVVYYSNCYINHCKKCLKSGKCVECYDNYYVNAFGKCDKGKDSNNSNHNSNPSVLATLISIIFFVLLVIIAYIREKEICINLPNQRRVNRDNLNNINNNIIININRSNLNEQRVSSNEIILNENELSDEFKRLRIKIENKLCQVCKKENGKYIGDCGCIVCQEHSNFKEVINIEGKFKICFNCGKTIKDLKLIKTSCQICLEEVPSLCHFKCGCAIEVCENCYIKCRKESKRCPACRGNI